MAKTTAPAASSALDLPRSAVGSRSRARCDRSSQDPVGPSTYWTLLAMFVVVVGFGALASTGAAHGPHGPYFDPTRQSLAGLYVGH